MGHYRVVRSDCYLFVTSINSLPITNPFSDGHTGCADVDLLFSIVLNRTLLWKYPESNVTCRKYKLRCELLNAEEDCAAMVARAPWLPSYDQWAPALGLDKIRVRQLPPVRSFEFRRKEAQRKDKSLTNLTSNDFYKGQYKHVSGHVGVKNPLKLVAYGRDFLDLDWVSDEDRSKLPNPYAVYQAEKLYSLGKTFLYGMLHRYTFDFSRKIQDSLPKVRVDPTAFTVAIHSRHPNDRRIPPCDVTREIKCVRELLEHQSLYPRAEELGEGKSKNCTVFLLTDRECTLDKMREWLEANTPCEVLIAPHEEGTGSRGEHGPVSDSSYDDNDNDDDEKMLTQSDTCVPFALLLRPSPSSLALGISRTWHLRPVAHVTPWWHPAGSRGCSGHRP